MSIAGKWGQLARDFEDDSLTAQNLSETRPPGNEYASANNADAIRNSGRVMSDGLKARADYCSAQADKFKKAAGEYQKADGEAAGTVNQYGGII